MKLTTNKQSLNDWTVEDEGHKTLAWVERKKGKSFGKVCTYFEVRYTNNLGIGGEDLTHDLSLTFKEAKALAYKAIDNWFKD